MQRDSVTAAGDDVRAAYAACRRMQRRHDPTYYWATRRLPAEVRPAVHALYGFVRGADEIVDGPRRPCDPAARRAALDRWEQTLRDGVAEGRSDHPVIAALVDAGRRHDLPLDELEVYMRSMRIDCGPVRIATRGELESYMRGSAGAVGRIMAPLLGASGAQAAEDYARLGVAFQLTNFIRDVRADYRLDRIYLPAEDRARFGVGEGQLARGEATPGFRALVADEVARARALFAATAPLTEAAPPAIRSGQRLARAVYLRVLDRIEALDFDVLRRRTGLPPWDWGRATVGALRPRGAP